jgi:hypothetical protein
MINQIMILILLLLKNEFHSFNNLCTSVHSGLVPVNCLRQLCVQFENNSRETCLLLRQFAGLEEYAPVYIKLVINYVTKPDRYGRTHANIIQYTYPVNIEETNYDLEFQSDAYNLDYYKVIDNSIFYQNDTELEVWDFIKITNNAELTTDDKNVTLKAGNVILVDGTNTISDGITLKIDLPLECRENQIQPESPYTIRNFCNSNNYKAKELQPTIIAPRQSLASVAKQTINKYNISMIKDIFPIPAVNSFTARYIIPVSGQYEIFLTDILGNRIEGLNYDGFLNPGMYSQLFRTEKLITGTYFVNLKTNSGFDRKSVVIIK